MRAIVAGAALVLLWPRFVELRDWRVSRSEGLFAIGAGVGVLAVWIVLDVGWYAFDLGNGFDPRRYGFDAIDWPIAFFRLLGLAVVVPLAEELFWRSFLLRWLEKQDFLSVRPAAVGLRALLITSALFALEHNQWLAGFIAGMVYGWIYMYTGRLWVPILAHAVTNGLLGAYILIMRDWRFW
jgi:CAAX prenyl protease-like protein